jgi:WD40 repeat protein
VDGEVVLYDLAAKARVWSHAFKLQTRTGLERAYLAFHPTRRILAAAYERESAVLEIDSGWPVLERPEWIADAAGAFTPDGRRLLTASTVGTVRSWDARTWTVGREYNWKVGGLTALAVAPDGSTAAVAGAEKKVVVWDLDD